MTVEEWVIKAEAGRVNKTREWFSADARVGPAHPAADPILRKLPAFYPKASSLVPALENTPLVSKIKHQNPPSVNTHVRIHT